ncbi:unnamed protein product [Orchesella dallaii]|uniref:Uncharacterized protein n=1 Tax=Orchesella dallaii TaxID=48710 RepID=A0ABP1PNQ1_9HEXA
MRSQILSLAAVALFARVVLLDETVAARPTIKRDISELTSVEKTLLRYTHPKAYKRLVSENQNEKSGQISDNSAVEMLNFDLPTLALHLSKSDNILLPTVHYEFNLWNFYQTFIYNEPIVRNANSTSVKTNLNATNIELEFQIPDLQIISEKFTLREYNEISGDEVIWHGWSMQITNYTIRLVANWELKQLVGLQVSNVELSFGVEDFRFRKENATHTLPDGRIEELGPEEDHYADQMIGDWERMKENITSDAETWLNCFLGGGRDTNGECEELLNDNYQIGNFVQMLQAIGLAIARGQEQFTGNNNENVGNNILPKILPNFPFPTINSAVQDLPTVLLQVWRILGIYNNIAIVGYPLSYDFIKENCTMEGECRDIQEIMSLPEFQVRGLHNSRVQLETLPNGMTNSLKVPQLTFEAAEFQRETIDLESGSKEIYKGLYLNVSADFAFSTNYELIDGVGLQVRGVGVTLRLRELRLIIPQYYTIENGEESKAQEYNVDIAPQIMDIWNGVDENGVSFERKYEQQIQDLINSLLIIVTSSVRLDLPEAPLNKIKLHD